MKHSYKVKLTVKANQGLLLNSRGGTCIAEVRGSGLPFSECLAKDGESDAFLKGSEVPANILLSRVFRLRSFEGR